MSETKEMSEQNYPKKPEKGFGKDSCLLALLVFFTSNLFFFKEIKTDDEKKNFVIKFLDDYGSYTEISSKFVDFVMSFAEKISRGALNKNDFDFLTYLLTKDYNFLLFLKNNLKMGYRVYFLASFVTPSLTNISKEETTWVQQMMDIVSKFTNKEYIRTCVFKLEGNCDYDCNCKYSHKVPHRYEIITTLTRYGKTYDECVRVANNHINVEDK
jgi:hypothetical protein